MGLGARCSIAVVTCLCYVQCQWVQVVESDVSAGNSSTEGLTSSNSGWSSSVSEALDHSQYSESTHYRGRTRRQAYYIKNANNNIEGRPYSWSHYFTIPPIYSNTKESAYVREENMKRLKNTLEKDTVFQFLSPTGLRISIPADSINIRIVDFRFKLNEEFRDNDGGHFAPNSFKRGGLWTYDIPQLQVKQGDKIYYWMNVKFNKEGTDIIVKGVLEITLGNPHVGGTFTDSIPFRPTTSPVLSPQPQNSYGGSSHTPTLGGGLGGGTRGAFIWNHQFSINSTHNLFTESSANSWLQQAELLKNSVQNTDFQFSNPTGLMILIPDNNINMRIEDFRVKLNEEFRGNDGGHYAPSNYKRGGVWTYNIPDLKAKQGDKIYYWMRVKLGKEGFDTIVRGVLEIPQGDPHQGSNMGHKPPSPIYPRPQPQVTSQQPPTVGGGLGGGIRGQQAVRWEHRFTINTTYNAGFTQESANRWLDEAQLFKNSLEKDIEFQFLNPTGLSISISGDNEDVKILAFNLKVNEEFRTLGPGQYVANVTQREDGRWSYFYPDVRLRQGDKVFYWMRVTLGKQAFDNIVKGVLEVTQGDPHIGGPGPARPLPSNLTPSRPPPLGTSQNQYPSQTYPNQRPPQSSSNQYPSQPPNRYPLPSNPNQYPSPSSSNKPDPVQPDPNPYPSPPNPSQPDSNKYPSQPCTPSQSSRNGDSTPPCQGELLLEHKFNTLDGWTHQITIGGKNPEDEFMIFRKDEDNVWVQQGRLYIKPTLLEDKTNDSYVRSGELIVEGCTSTVPQECHRKGNGYLILPPINSARINTQNTFTFRYGTVEMRAKLPRGDWIVPELWLEPSNSAIDEKVIIGVAKGNTGSIGNQMGAGIVRTSDKKLPLMNITGSTPWFQGFHTFKLEWTPDHIRFLVDNQQIHDLSTESFAVTSHEVYLSLGVHVGGYRDFPDEMFPNKPWKNSDPKRFARFWNAKKDWYPTWKNDPTLQVDYIRVNAL